jgi:hypothetical protein
MRSEELNHGTTCINVEISLSLVASIGVLNNTMTETDIDTSPWAHWRNFDTF